MPRLAVPAFSKDNHDGASMSNHIIRQPRSNVEWRQWAKTDPLYGIATLHERQRNGTNPWTLSEFYEVGAQHWRECLLHWEQYGVRPISCVEIGCGAGRMTRQLAGFFEVAIGIDVAEEMLALARTHAPEGRYLLGTGTTLPVEDASVSAAFSYEVFQHFDRREITISYFREIHRILEHGGTCMVHIPLAILPFAHMFPTMARIQRSLWHLAESWLRAKSQVKRLLIKAVNRRPFLLVLQYEPDWLYTQLSGIGFQDVEIRVVPTRVSSGTADVSTYLNAYVLARKLA
jgi:ubiquinone/menaquinone biosynthesis C-methylase UbiE